MARELRNYPVAFLGCRVYGHGWQEYTSDQDDQYDEVLRCVRCKRTRKAKFDRWGDLKGSFKYSNVEGYSLQNKYRKSEFRKELHRRRTNER